MAPLSKSRQQRGGDGGHLQRGYLRQRLARSMASGEPAKELAVESNDDNGHGEDDGGGRDDRQEMGNRQDEYRQKREEEGDDYSDDEDDGDQSAIPLPSSETLMLTAMPTTTLQFMPTSTPSNSPLSTMDVPIAANPQITVSVSPTATTSYISPVTTQSVHYISMGSLSSQSIHACDGSDTPTSATSVSPTCVQLGVQTTLFAFEHAPTPMSSSDGVENYSNDMGNGMDHHGDHGSSSGSLSPATEHALISVGSIGGFIIVAFVLWLAWRMFKKVKRKEEGNYGNQFSQRNSIFPPKNYFRRTQRGWQGLDDMPPRYEKTTSMGQASEVYSMSGQRSMSQPIAKAGPSVPRQLQTDVSSSNTVSAYSTPTPLNMRDPQTGSPHSQINHQPAAQPQHLPNLSPAKDANPFNNTMRSPDNAASNFDSGGSGSIVQDGESTGTAQTLTKLTTDRSPAADPFYSQSELAGQPSGAYDSSRRHVQRASELSSISSGFGDGDIIIPPPTAWQQPNFQGVPRYTYHQVPDMSRKDSITNASEVSSSHRDTIITTTSEDMPVRYRTVNSWVDQQSGRLRRAAQRTDEDVPPLPLLPPEEERYLMLDDEEPRRPDMVPAPIAALPKSAAKMIALDPEDKETNP